MRRPAFLRGISIALMACGVLGLDATSVSAQTTRVIPYRGHLDGLSAGTATVDFQIVDPQQTELWPAANSWESHSIVPNAGNFTVLVGSQQPIPPDVLARSDLAFRVRVNGVVLTGSQRLIPSFRAATSETSAPISRVSARGSDMVDFSPSAPASRRVGVGQTRFGMSVTSRVVSIAKQRDTSKLKIFYREHLDQTKGAGGSPTQGTLRILIDGVGCQTGIVSAFGVGMNSGGSAHNTQTVAGVCDTLNDGSPISSGTHDITVTLDMTVSSQGGQVVLRNWYLEATEVP